MPRDAPTGAPSAFPVFVDAETVARFGWKAAVGALEDVLLRGLDPETDPPRTCLSLGGSDLWFMPGQTEGWLGAKLVTVAAANSARGLPTVQGLYVLFDTATSAPAAVIEGAALTTLRTASVSALAVRHLAPGPLGRLVVFGTGVQARAHVDAIRAVSGVESVDVVGRSAPKVEGMVAELLAHGVDARRASADVVAEADVVVCATTASTPLFDGRAVAPGATVVAIGSGSPTAREVDSNLVSRSTVVVESRAAAMHENGNVLLALADGAVSPNDLLNLADLIGRGSTTMSDQPRLFTGSGMAWQDLTIATAVLRATLDASS